MGALLSNFASEGVHIEAAGDGRLRAHGPLTDELRTAIRANKRAILAELAANDVALSARRWRIHFPNLAPVEVLFTPEVTRAEALDAWCLGATDAIPIPEPATRTATAAEADELRELIGAILPDEAGRAEALRVAFGDPETALICFRRLASEK